MFSMTKQNIVKKFHSGQQFLRMRYLVLRLDNLFALTIELISVRGCRSELQSLLSEQTFHGYELTASRACEHLRQDLLLLLLLLVRRLLYLHGYRLAANLRNYPLHSRRLQLLLLLGLLGRHDTLLHVLLRLLLLLLFL